MANTTAIKQYDGLKHRGCESDARHLTHVIRLGLLPEGHIMPKANRAFRDLAHRRMQLVGQRTSQIVSIETSMAQHMGAAISGSSVKELTSDDIDAMPIRPTGTLGMKANLPVMQALQVQIDGIEATLSKHCRRHIDYRLLWSVAGIGPILATVILLETGDIGRFADVGNNTSYYRWVGSAHMSNGKKKGEGNTKKRQPLLGIGICRSCQFCDPLLRSRPQILSAEKKSQTKQRRGHQSGGP
ncbi:transposase [Caballeronia sp. DA-9]|uniref:transposase n=1 Tax=Caballeronia sp. DA-9 TaxID=3436237 RepID=UPI003F680795